MQMFFLLIFFSQGKFAKNGLVGTFFFKLWYITDNERALIKSFIHAKHLITIKHFHTKVLINHNVTYVFI